LVTSSRLGDQPSQDLNGEDFVFLVQGFPGIGLIEKQIEEI
jgi:hypothetical protein